ncbi:response regulator transcription factor [Microbacterium sp. KSW2-21]|uniref:Response regulator transcription factor n=1 Tax=Microbacterium algihabitans TaxID=3075992 RepID=A0ABU3RZX4_9MICO|nr:response regulator transcription factor [Microbacterium sp. KSW2-21]MDU0328436.1 response regulator transcription factor [Microbacterium sp. KSW2-21]
MIRVMIVDDQAMIREGLRAVLAPASGIDVVSVAADGLEALALLEDLEVDVVLMDIRMPGIDGVETTRRIRQRVAADRLRIVVLTTFDTDENVLSALRAGANGFLSKGVGPDELAEGIREVAAGGGALSAAASAVLIGQVAQTPAPSVDPAILDRFAALTPRERDVVIAIATGADNTQIAAQMFVSPFTVKTHANRAMAKLGARDRAQLVALTYRAGLAG